MASRKKSFTPRFLATYIALFISLVSTGLGFITIFLAGDKLAFLVFSGLTIFIFTFIGIYFVLNQFIISKIKPIYQTIQIIESPEKKLFTNIDHIDIISEVTREVKIWAQKKIVEIEHLKTNERFRREFIGNVAHELKTPIFNIQGYILTLRDGAYEDKKILRKYLKRTEKNIDRLITIIRDVDTISQLEVGGQKLVWETFNLIDLIEDSCEMHEELAAKYAISLTFEGDYDVPVPVHADKQRILEVLNNLVVNSIKYGRSGGQTTVTVRDGTSLVFVSVADDGIGIAEEHLHRIFERFYRVDKSRSREQGGSGLGLSIVKHIIEAHNQTINVKSEPGKGSIFTFTLQKALNR